MTTAEANEEKEAEARPDWVGQRAIAWVLDEAPVPTDLAITLVAIARRCDEHGKGSYQSVPTLAAKTGKSPDQVRRDIAKLLELKLIRRGDQTLPEKNGVPPGSWPVVYDVALELSGPKPVRTSKNKSGKKKPSEEADIKAGGMDATPGMDAGGCMDATPTPGMDARGTPCMDATQTKPLNNPLNNPSSLSRGDRSVPAPRGPGSEDRERDMEASRSKPQPTAYRVLAAEGVDTDEADLLIPIIEAENEVRSDGFWRHVAKNRDIVNIIAKARATLKDQAAGACANCSGAGKVADRSQYGVYTDCPACMPPGAKPEVVTVKPGRCPEHPAYPARTCGPCRADRLAVEGDDLNRQSRSSQRGHQPYRNPKDQSVYEDWASFRPGYARRSNGSEVLVNSHHPDRIAAYLEDL